MKQRPIDDDIVLTGHGPGEADCNRCELFAVCNGPGGRPIMGERPRAWQPGGLMLVGEGPGRTEVSYQRPFVGQSGRALDRMLQTVGLERGRCWLTNATLAYPEDKYAAKAKGKGVTFSKRFPLAVYSCVPRLEAEIAEARPRVIVTLGRSAFQALAGETLTKTRLVPNPCSEARCEPATRRVGPVIACAKGDCDWYALAPSDVEAAGREEEEAHRLRESTVEGVPPEKVKLGGWKPEAWKAWAAKLKETHKGACPSCAARISGLRPRKMKCPTCGGKKKRTEEYPVYTDPYPLIGRNGVAGAIFRAADLPSRLDEFGVEYIVPTYHPSFCLRPVTGSKRNADGERAIGGQFAARVLAEHLAKARRLLSSETRWQDPKPLWTRDPDVVARWLAAPGRYSVDIETNSYDGPEAVTQIVCIGFARRDREEALVIDTRHLPTALEGAELDDPILHALRAFFARDDVETVYWNGLYDRYVMWRLWRVWDHAFANDGKAAHNALWPDEEHTLAFAAHELLDAPHWKDPGKKIPSGEYDDLSGYPDEDSLALYNARDCRATLELDTVFRGPPGSRGLLHEEDVLAAWQSDVNNYELALRMQVAGMPLNLATRRELEAGFLDRIRGLEAKMANIVGRSADDWSPTGGDLAWALFDPDGPLRLPVLATTATGKPSTEKSLLKRLVGQAPEFIPTYLKWKAETYNLSHYVQGAGLEPGPDGRLHPTWKPGLRTGRWSSTPNLQNWPYRNPELNMRKLIEAPPGRVLVGADYAQLELRIMAALAGDPKLIALINNADEARKLEADYDPHSYLARAVFGKAWTEAPKGDRKRLRDTVKRVWYGSLYGAGATTIIDSILDSDYAGPPLTVPFVEGVLRMISTEFEGVQRWRQRAWETMQQEHAVFSPLTGRRRIFPLGQLEITVAYNYPIQSGAGDIVNERAWILDDRLVDVDPTAAIIAQVHDALYVECAEDRAEAVAACVTDTLTIERAFLEGAPPMRFDAQAEIGQRWDQV